MNTIYGSVALFSLWDLHTIFNMCNKLYLTVCTFFKDYVLSLLINVIVRYPY